ncbi:MAG: glycosyltransferase family 2 protein [Candidatus Coatesbacteria bacterium]|nr:glycosyltransferase family 2 protein [Candidatus Coatesbacteria bacterium]
MPSDSVVNDSSATRDAPDLSVIVVSYNSSEHLERCLRDVLRAAEGIRFEVIIVDNASCDDSVRTVLEAFGDRPWLTVIRNEKNLGYGKACNMGADPSSGRYVLFLNPDVFVGANALGASLAAFSEQSRCGAVTARMFWDDEMEFMASFLKEVTPMSALIQHTSLRRFLGRRVFEKFWKADWDVWASEVPVPVSSAPAGYLMLPRGVFESLGGFDERFFLYYEDDDLCARIRKAGLDIYVVPDASAVHYCGQSLKSFDRAGMGRIQRKSLFAFYSKHYPVLGRALSAAIFAEQAAKRAAKAVLKPFASREAAGGALLVAGDEGVELRWPAEPDAEFYFLEVSLDPCFITKVGAKTIATRYLLCHNAYRKLPLDVYFWRAVPMKGAEAVGRIEMGRFRRVESKLENA